ncbi:hypothetical protein CDCA_CDCA15G4022 [Cyanidium caldarium]|uniref:Nicotinate-nucleotide pyrophosphorylase [carboxylating] n=1 Tax=Cyanidium caldarium TaxID=2771 RepID=A0AAV9J0A6_CYACA|nr:hypothetical protein CDCA_CDCA15G4022 [Cyanidium caldarium]
MDALPLPVDARQTIQRWLREDAPSFDYGGAVVGATPAQGMLWIKSSGVLAGRPWFDAVFAELGCAVRWTADWEGQWIAPTAHGSSTTSVTPVHLATVTGPAQRLLLGERLALNLLSRCSGVATAAHAYRQLAKQRDWHGVVAGTRKTTPGFRAVEKYGMQVGGADMHRMDLSSMVMLKDNHLASVALACGGSVTDAHTVQEAVRRARLAAGFALKVEVECSSEETARVAILAGAEVVMLDNMPPAMFRDVAARLRRDPQLQPYQGGYRIEASGGITLDTVGEYMCADADIVSVSLAQQYRVVDFSLKVVLTPE